MERRTIVGIAVAVVIVVVAFLYFGQPPSPPTTPPQGAQQNAGLEVGSGPNLLASQEDFTKPDWFRQGVTATANAGPAPDGSNTATKIAETADPGFHRIMFNVNGLTPGGDYTLSFFVSPAERNKMLFEMLDRSPGKYGVARFDLARKVYYPDKDTVIKQAGVKELPGGWLRVWATMPFATNAAGFNLTLLNDASANSYAGTAGAGLLIWGAQFEPGELHGYNGNPASAK